MIRMITGACRIGSELITPASGAFEADEKTEKRLVSLGVAEFVNTGIATPVICEEEDETSENKLDEEKPTESEIEGYADTPEYSVDSSVSVLRKIAKENGITFKVGMTKEEMVNALDEFFNDAPDLGVEEPIV